MQSRGLRPWKLGKVTFGSGSGFGFGLGVHVQGVKVTGAGTVRAFAIASYSAAGGVSTSVGRRGRGRGRELFVKSVDWKRWMAVGGSVEGGGVRRFAPLGGGEEQGGRRLRGVIFDLDGTLCEPQTYMFSQMRNALGIDKSTDIIDHIYSLPIPDQEAAHEKIRAIEREAMLTQIPQPGLQTLFTYLTTQTPPLRLAILTRNHQPPVDHLLSTHLPTTHFFPILTRDFLPPKPHPAGIFHIAQQWDVDPKDTIMVGDSIDDMKAGYLAGAATVLLGNSVNGEMWDHEYTDLVVQRLDELVAILEGGFVGRVERRS